MSTVTLQLPDDKAARLAEAARGEGLELSDLLQRLADEYLERQAAVDAAARYVLRKNAELYRRLAR